MSAKAAIGGGHGQIVTSRGQWHPSKCSMGWYCDVWHPWKSSISGDCGFGDIRKNAVELNRCLTGLCVWWREQGIALGLAESGGEIFCGGKEDVSGPGGGH